MHVAWHTRRVERPPEPNQSRRGGEPKGPEGAPRVRIHSKSASYLAGLSDRNGGQGVRSCRELHLLTSFLIDLNNLIDCPSDHLKR